MSIHTAIVSYLNHVGEATVSQIAQRCVDTGVVTDPEVAVDKANDMVSKCVLAIRLREGKVPTLRLRVPERGPVTLVFPDPLDKAIEDVPNADIDVHGDYVYPYDTGDVGSPSYKAAVYGPADWDASVREDWGDDPMGAWHGRNE